MASIGHVAIGLAAARSRQAGRLPLRSFAAAASFWSALSLLPDIDVIGFSRGVRYEDPWGHRGATHSFAFAIVAGAIVGAAAAIRRRSPLRDGGLASAVLASHLILDTLTDGGLGCALFWPFSLTRYFAPWNPIPVAPIGLAFFSPFGLAVAAVELVQFSPLFVWGWSPATFQTLWLRRRGFVVAWLAVVLLLLSPLSGGVREKATGLVLREDTEYAAGFSERRLNQIAPGASRDSVKKVLGDPLQVAWSYPPDRNGACFLLFIERGQVVYTREAAACRERGVLPGQAADAVRSILGEADGTCWMYTRSPSNRFYRLRAVCFRNEMVEEVLRFWWQD